jgi:hypothetical protein
MTDAPGRTKKQLAAVEQEKAVAFRQGIAAFKAGQGVESNAYLEDPREHMAPAWRRGWEAEHVLRTQINPRERRA